MESLLEPTPDSAWVFTAEGFDPLREAIYESRFSISNGFLGLRAGRAVSRGERWVVPHRAYVAGVFDIPGPEHPIPALVPAPGWQQIRKIRRSTHGMDATSTLRPASWSFLPPRLLKWSGESIGKSIPTRWRPPLQTKMIRHTGYRDWRRRLISATATPTTRCSMTRG